jgi:hypothetical protein
MTVFIDTQLINGTFITINVSGIENIYKNTHDDTVVVMFPVGAQRQRVFEIDEVYANFVARLETVK